MTEAILPKVTLDTNCIIDLEMKTLEAHHIEKIVQAHQKKKIRLRVVAMGASESKPDGTCATNYREFQKKINAIGLSDVEALRPIAYLGMAFLDYCVFGGGEATQLERGIHDVLFPEIQFDYREYCGKHGISDATKLDRVWRNAKCDVLGLWSHRWNGGGVFATRDKNFLRKVSDLKRIVPSNVSEAQELKVLTPETACQEPRL